ncbi:myb-like dna-binding domain-containing protein [Stylonychia lemnae]|uniref:Myb-like dna-binding domain-containing protein n=1 Tax=Stylonychia lemnae TaxID=5949 RepID=A0A077ZWS1_STYLE|nr:myb-like dna-binding domain-containing protein [Stylonychia lemnae]|eukprot:CDW73737.1 myb-like dna-binding domain-containing protein [Stylonychia lemnae]
MPKNLLRIINLFLETLRILSKNPVVSKGLPSETETKKRQRLLEIKDQEGGKKCLSPSIFRKSRGPIIFAVQSSNFTSQNGNLDVPVKTGSLSSKRIDGNQVAKELNLQDFDINLCAEPKDVHRKNNHLKIIVQSYKCFDNYLGMVSQLYCGLPLPQNLGKGRQDPLMIHLGLQTKKQQQNQQSGTLNGGSSDPQLSNQKIEASQEADQQQSSNNYYRPANYSKDENRFKFTTFDELINPLRSDHPFELWAPKEIAIFEACICRYGKNFDKFSHFIKTKSQKEIVDFYFAWKKTSHYRCWKSKQDKRKVTDNQNDWVFQ